MTTHNEKLINFTQIHNEDEDDEDEEWYSHANGYVIEGN